MKVLLHICCGVCATVAAERLLCEGHTVTGYFYNPCIHPVDEYRKRLKAAQTVAEKMNFELVEGPYDREKWFERIKGKEYEPEGEKRCRECFRMRLEKTYDHMKKKMFDAFTTTLTASPLKSMEAVNSIGREIGGDKFILADFKKKDGFKRAQELSREWNLYKQTYCGCIYSLESSLAKEKKSEKKT